MTITTSEVERMSEPGTAPTRVDQRKARTRAALIAAAQTLLAAGRSNVPILEITQLADIGTGSFYNHFETREELFAAAVADALDAHGAVLDHLTEQLDDPADAFATSFRITGRLHRRQPELSKVVLASGFASLSAETGLAPRLRRDLAAGVQAGRFRVDDLDLAIALIAGAALSLGHLLHSQPDRDDAEATDAMTERLLVALGTTPARARRLARHPLPDLSTVFGTDGEKS